MYLYLHPFAVGLWVGLIILTAALFLSLWAGRRLFAALAAKSRVGAGIAAFVWYIILFFYFSASLFILPTVLLSAFDTSDYLRLLDRAASSAGNYAIGLFFLLLVAGGVALFLLIKRQVAPAAAPVSLARALWHGTRGALLAVLLVFFVLVTLRTPVLIEQEKTPEQIEKIRATKLTLEDVMGTNLPIPPNPELKDTNIAGFDSNRNGIRDDVELAIFEAYPNSARTRAALLQYALIRQMELTQELVNSETVTTVAEQSGRANLCIAELVSSYIVSRDENLERFIEVGDEFIEFVETNQLNTSARKEAQKSFYAGKLRSYSTPRNISVCDIDLSTLPN